MKKRIAILTIVVALVVVFAVVLSSCGIKDTIQNLIPGDGNGDGDTISPANDYDSTQIESRINALAAQGIKISLRVTGSDDDEGEYEAETYAYGAYGDIFYYCYGEEDQQMYFDLSSDEQFVLYQMEQDGFDYYWTKTIYYYDDLYNKAQLKQVYGGMAVGIWGMLGYYAGLNGEGTKTVATMLGRTCDKYVMTQSVAVIGAAASISYECWIDQQTGVCLKYAISGSAVSTDGRESGSFAIEATEFNTAWRPQLPEVSQTHTEIINPESASQGGGEVDPEGGASRPQGGGEVDPEGGASRPQGGGEVDPEGGASRPQGGGEGESEQDRGPFIDKRLAVTAVNIPDNRALEQYFEGGYVQLYSSMDFECISDFCCLLGHFVSNHNATSGTAHLNAIKIYADGKYDYESAESMAEMELVFADGEYTLTFELYVEDTLTEIELTLEDAGRIQAHDNDVCPLDPNGYGIDPVYQVTQAEWDGIFKGDWLFEEIGNFTVDWDVASETWPHSGTFKADYSFINDDGMFIYSRETWEPDQDGLYEFNAYYYNSGAGTWSDQGSAYIDLVDQWDDYTGAIPADFMKAGYNSVDHNYYINSFSYIPSGYSSRVEVTNFRVWFSSNLLVKIEYTRAGETLTFEFSDYNDTEVDVPDLD